MLTFALATIVSPKHEIAGYTSMYVSTFRRTSYLSGAHLLCRGEVPTAGALHPGRALPHSVLVHEPRTHVSLLCLDMAPWVLPLSCLLGGILFYNFRSRRLSPAYIGPVAGQPDLVLRELRHGDFGRGFPAILSQLTTVGAASRKELQARLRLLRASGSSVVVVLHDTVNDVIVGTASLFIEPKFIHSNGTVGHIEDVVVSEQHRGKNLGKALIDVLKDTAKNNGCYKTILDCAESRVLFYQKCGMEVKGIQMAIYH